MRHEHFLRLASRVATNSLSKFRLGAVLVHRNQVLSVGFNRMDRSHPIQQKYCGKEAVVGLHAELSACLGIDREELAGTTIYVARLLRNGKPALARPCSGCAGFLSDYSVKQAIYTTENGFETLDLLEE